MFVASKLLWAMANPPAVAFALLLAGTALLFTRWRRAGRAMVVGVVGFSVVAGVVPVGSWLVNGLENRFPPPPELSRVDGVIVLGGEVDQVLSQARGQPALPGGAARSLAFADLARRYPEARLVFAGGSGLLLRQDVTEAEAMKPVFALLGVSPGRVIYEDRSRNTRENALFSRDLVRPQPGEVWVLVTSAAHMPRAVGCFRAVGWPVVPWPVGYRTPPEPEWSPRFNFEGGLWWLADALREIIGLAAYRWAGWTDSWFPGP